MIFWTLTAEWLDEAKEPQGAVIGVFNDFTLMVDEATKHENASEMLNSPQYSAASWELNELGAQQVWVRSPNGEWHRIPKP